MGNPRQQRAKRNRRLTTTNNPARVPQLAVRIIDLTTAHLDVQGVVIATPPATLGTAAPLVLAGIPQLRRTYNNTYPATAVLLPDGLTLRMTWPGPPLFTDESWVLGIQDPAVRTAQGGYLAPGIITLPQFVPPEVTPATVEATITSSNTLDITITPTAATLCVLDPVRWMIDAGGGFGASAVYPMFAGLGVPYTFQLTVTGALISGATLQYIGPQLPIGNTGVCAPSAVGVVLA